VVIHAGTESPALRGFRVFWRHAHGSGTGRGQQGGQSAPRRRHGRL